MKEVSQESAATAVTPRPPSLPAAAHAVTSPQGRTAVRVTLAGLMLTATGNRGARGGTYAPKALLALRTNQDGREARRGPGWGPGCSSVTRGCLHPTSSHHSSWELRSRHSQNSTLGPLAAKGWCRLCTPGTCTHPSSGLGFPMVKELSVHEPLWNSSQGPAQGPWGKASHVTDACCHSGSHTALSLPLVLQMQS